MANTSLTTADFNAFRQELMTQLLKMPKFTNANFSGENWSFVLDVFGLVTEYLAYMASSTVNNMFLDTTQIREVALSICKMLNYSPYRSRAATARVSVTLVNEAAIATAGYTFTRGTSSINIPKNTLVVGSDSSTFLTIQDTVLNAANNYTVLLDVMEGTIVGADKSLSIGTSNGEPFQTFVIDDTQMADGNLILTTGNDSWTEIKSALKFDQDLYQFMVQENFYQTFNVNIGGRSLGRTPVLGEEIFATYIRTSGALGNQKNDFSIAGPTYLEGNLAHNLPFGIYSTSTISPSAGGTEKEDLESIRTNGPLLPDNHHTLVIKSDYQAYLRTHALVEQVSVWGGDENVPPTPGFVYAAIKPPGRQVLTAFEDETIRHDVSARCESGIRFRLASPTYINMGFDVKYQYDALRSRGVDVDQMIRNTVLSFMATMIATHTDFSASSFICALDDTPYVLRASFNLKTSTTITQNSTGSYYINLDQELKPGTVYLNIDGVTTVGFKDNGDGDLIDVADNEIIGEVDYLRGIIIIWEWTKVPTVRKQFIQFELDSQHVDLSQGLIFNYDPSSSSFTKRT